MSKKDFISKVLTGTKFHKAVRKARSKGTQFIPILAYHRVMDIPTDYPFDSDLVSASIDGFKEQMNYLHSHYSPLTMQEMIAHIKGEKINKKNPILITFDDGFGDNYTNAFPILKELEIPATFFLTTDFIDSEELLWYEKLAFIIKKSKLPSISIKELSKSYILKERDQRQKVYTQIVEALKLLENNDREKILLDIFNSDPSLDIALEHWKHLSCSMSWSEIELMLENGMDFGSHTVTHPILSNISNKQLANELVESKCRIEQQLNTEIKTIAYPVGQRESISEEVALEVQKAGYELGFSYIDGVDLTNKFSIGRIHVDYDMPMSRFKSKLLLPKLFCD